MNKSPFSSIKSIFENERAILAIYLFLYLCAAVPLMLMQPFGNPPDEYNRYLIPQYIYSHRDLPNGYDPSIRIGGYGFSYAFQPILPYQFQGYAMKLAGLFKASEQGLLLAARSVDLIFGFIMAIFVFYLAKEWFSDRKYQNLFRFLVTFLPQALFLHTYVNTDSCCMLSIAMILYGLTKGLKDHFSVKNSMILSIGIILCALSYYNAYGFILSSMLLFLARFLISDDNRWICDWKSLLKKGLLISVVVLCGISWWFIRSAILYQGDFLGLASRKACALLYAIPEFHPDTMVTWENQGYSFFEMLKTSDFINLSTISFIAMFGAMSIVTSIWIYRLFKLIFGVGVLSFGITLPFLKKTSKAKEESELSLPNKLTVFYHLNMLMCIAIPCYLSAYYSYTTDYQPQGRYLMPALLPLCFFCISGYQNVSRLLSQKKLVKQTLQSAFSTSLCTVTILVILVSLFVTIWCYAYPYYLANPIAP